MDILFRSSLAFVLSGVVACAAGPSPADGVASSEVIAIDPECTLPEGVVVSSGGTLSPRPHGSALRLVLVYQGGSIGITSARGADMTLPGTSGPLRPGFNSGYWYELQDASGKALYTRSLPDPSRIEAHGPDGPTSAVVPRCEEVLVLADVPNDPGGTAIVFYGSPHGTQLVAAEIARFSLR
jgi:hypothetical protein